MMTRVIYDMDQTITRAATYTRWLIYWARREAPWRLALLPVAAIAGIGFRLGLVSRRRLKEFAQRLVMGDAAPRTKVESHAADFAAKVVARGLMPGAVAQIATDRSDGHEIVIATASFAFYAHAIASALGIDRVIATESTWDGDRLRAQIAGENCFGAAKAATVVAAMPGARFVRAYSDHVSDAPLFALAAEPVAVTPSRALRRLAVERGWRIVDWR